MRPLAVIACAAALGLPPSAALAQAPEPAPGARDPAERRAKVDELAWDPRWGTFSTGEYVATGFFVLGALASLGVPPFEGTWSGANALDTSVRDTFRLPRHGDRDTARDASDLLLTGMINHLMVDTVVVTWWGHGKGSTAWQMTLIDIEALALNGFLNGAANVIAGRERPYSASCVGPVERQNRDCTGSKKFRSYFSGHTSTAFTVAGLLCQHHAQLPIYGGGTTEAILTCTAGFLAASAVGTARVIADQHFATDALSGAAVGTAIGLGVPWFLHYGRGESPTLRPTAQITLSVVPQPSGGAVVGQF